MPFGGRFPIIYKNLVVILLSGATSRKQPTFQRRQTVRWSQFEATGGQLSATGEIISLPLTSVQVLKISFVSLSQDYFCLFVSGLFLSLCLKIFSVSCIVQSFNRQPDSDNPPDVGPGNRGGSSQLHPGC